MILSQHFKEEITHITDSVDLAAFADMDMKFRDCIANQSHDNGFVSKRLRR